MRRAALVLNSVLAAAVGGAGAGAEEAVRPALVLDEARHLRADVLEDLRLLTNCQMDAENRLCLLLMGQTELRRRLTMAVHKVATADHLQAALPEVD